MTLLIFGLALALVSMVLLELRKAYAVVPEHELKRRARIGDSQAERLYRTAAYGPNARLLLAVLIGLGAAGSFVLLTRSVQPVVAFAMLAVIVWIAFVWLPATYRLEAWSLQLAALISPAIAKLLSWIYPLTNFLTSPVSRGSQSPAPQDIYETEDLLQLLDRQKQAGHNRIAEHELEAASRVLQFTRRSTGQAMLPRAQVKLVAAGDTIGPLLLDELHERGPTNFLVYEGKRDHLVGTISLHDALSAAPGGKVADVMQTHLCYINETQPLPEVLQAFRTTHQHVFAVINNAGEFVGTLGIEDILTEALGEAAEHQSPAYEDREAVAGYHFTLEPIAIPADELPEEQPPEPEESTQSSAEDSESSTAEPPEVIE